MKNSVTIEQLKEEGNKVLLRHFKREDGGFTTKAAIIKDNKVSVGTAKCHPSDQFSKKKARAIALGRIAKGKADKFTFETEDDLNSLLKDNVFTLPIL